MIKGIGVDLVEIARMEESLKRDGFLERVFTVKEIENEHGNRGAYYAGRFACKEAVFKALGKPKNWLAIETLTNPDGSPVVTNYPNIHISISHENGMAIAFCIAEEE